MCGQYRPAAALIFAVVTSVQLACAGQILHKKAEQNEARVTDAGAKATPTKAVATSAATDEARSGSEASNVGWLDGIAVRLDAKKKGEIRTSPLVGIVIHSTRGPNGQNTLKKVQTDDATSWHFTVDRDGTVYQHVALNVTAAHAGDALLQLADGRTTDKLNDETLGIELTNLGGLVKDTGSDGKPGWKIWEAPKRKKEDKKYHYVPASLPAETMKLPAAVENRMKQAGELKVPKDPADPQSACLSYDAYYEEFPPKQIDALVSLLEAIGATEWHRATQVLVAHQRVATKPIGRKIDPGPLFPWEALQGFNYLPPIESVEGCFPK